MKIVCFPSIVRNSSKPTFVFLAEPVEAGQAAPKVRKAQEQAKEADSLALEGALKNIQSLPKLINKRVDNAKGKTAVALQASFDKINPESNVLQGAELSSDQAKDMAKKHPEVVNAREGLTLEAFTDMVRNHPDAALALSSLCNEPKEKKYPLILAAFNGATDTRTVAGYLFLLKPQDAAPLKNSEF